MPFLVNATHAMSTGASQVRGLGSSSQGMGLIVMGVCWWALRRMRLGQSIVAGGCDRSAVAAPDGLHNDAAVLRPFLLESLFPFLSLQGACRLDQANFAIHTGSTWGWEAKFLGLCQKYNLREPSVARVKAAEHDSRLRARMVFQQEVSPVIPFLSLWDFWVHHRATVIMSVAPICMGSLTVMLLHWLQCPSFDFSGGYPISTFFSDLTTLLENLPHDLLQFGGGGVGDCLLVIVFLVFGVWFVIILVKAGLGLLWMTLQFFDSVLGILGQSILANFCSLELAAYRSVGVLLGSCFTSFGLLALAFLAVLIAYGAARRRDLWKRQEFLQRVLCE